MKILIFGGSFNPVHNGHVHLFNAFRQLVKPNLTIIIPTFIPVHKRVGGDFLSPEHRLNMCSLAFAGEGVEISDIETASSRACYTFDTLTQLKKRYPDGEFYLACGADMFLTFDKWYRFEDIYRLAVICGIRRSKSDASLDAFAKAQAPFGMRALIADAPEVDISSTQVRQLITSGGDWSALVPSKVADYIRQNGLYTWGIDEPLDAVRARLKATLSEKRCYHSFCVADMAKRLAQINGCDPDKAYFAGLVHDIVRELPREQALDYARRNDVKMSELELASPNLWHAMIGAEFIQTELGVRDSDIINAVRYHTTGRAGMSLLERIVYVADCTSADRKYSNVDEIRELALSNLNRAVKASLDFTVEDLTRKGIPVHPDTLAALAAFCE